MDARGIPKEDAKHTTFPRSRATPNVSQKNDSDNSPGRWGEATFARTPPADPLQLTFPFHQILGASPNLTVNKSSSQDMRQVKQGSNRRPGKGIKATNGYLKSSLGITTQRSTTYILLPTSVNPGKTGILPSSPDQAQQKSGRADISKNSHLLLASAIFPTMPSGANGVSRWVSSWSSAICGENNFPSFPYGQCLAETPFALGHVITGGQLM